jgi:hypothetical protein
MEEFIAIFEESLDTVQEGDTFLLSNYYNTPRKVKLELHIYPIKHRFIPESDVKYKEFECYSDGIKYTVIKKTVFIVPTALIENDYIREYETLNNKEFKQLIKLLTKQL